MIGGILAATLGYISIFWTLSIFSAIILLITILLLPETLRTIAGNGSVPLKGILYAPALSISAPWNQAKMKASELELENQRVTLRMFYEPLLFLFEKDIFCTLVNGAIIFAVWSMVFASTTVVMQRAYGLNTLQYVSTSPTF